MTARKRANRIPAGALECGEVSPLWSFLIRPAAIALLSVRCAKKTKAAIPRRTPKSGGLLPRPQYRLQVLLLCLLPHLHGADRQPVLRLHHVDRLPRCEGGHIVRDLVLAARRQAELN